MASPLASTTVSAIVATNTTSQMRRPHSWEVKRDLRAQTDLIQERETDKGTVWGNQQGLDIKGMLSKLDSVLAANDEFKAKMKEDEAKSKEERSAWEAKSKEERSAWEVKIGEHEVKSKGERSALEAKIEKHEAEIKQLMTKGDAQGVKIRDLTRASRGYLDIRARFLAVYQRKHHKINIHKDSEGPQDPEEAQGKSPIAVGNERAHHGDAAIDAIVCRESRAQKFNDETFRELYYIGFEKALELDTMVREDKLDEIAFQMLDKRGTLVAAKGDKGDKGEQFSEVVEEAFKKYMDGIYDDRKIVDERGKKLLLMMP